MFTFGNEAGEKNFSENIRLFGNARTDPEKYNLYKGLELMAEAIKTQKEEIEQLRKKLDLIIFVLDNKK